MRHLWTGCGIFTGPSSRRLRPPAHTAPRGKTSLLHQMNPPFGLETSQSDRDGTAVEGAAEPLAEAGVELLGHGRGAEGYRGRESRLSSRPPLPPNRTCGSPASGSPVGGFTSERVDGLSVGCEVGEQPTNSKEAHCLLRPQLRGPSTWTWLGQTVPPRPVGLGHLRLG